MTPKREPIPAWLQQQLIADGHMTERHVTRKIKPRRCRQCRAACLAGIDDTGCESWVDPHLLTVEGEMYALMAGRDTYMVFGEEMCTRDAGRISHRDANAIPVFATHKCGAPKLPTKSPPKTKTEMNPDEIPF